MSLTADTSKSPRTFEEAEANLAISLPGYEGRPQQRALAQAVENSIANRTHLIAEAGCGTGKSLGYLIPAILSGKRAVISTATKALQDQVASKDAPFLQAHLGVDFTFAVLKGRSNYLCVNKALTVDPGDCPELSAILREAEARKGEAGFEGTREEFSFDIPLGSWMKVASESDDCQALDCKHNHEGCFAQMAKIRASESQVVIVNHALFLTDLKVREVTGGFASLLDNYETVVFDEAHELEEYAGNALGSQFKEAGVRAFCTEMVNFASRYLGPKAVEQISDLTTDILSSTQALWSVLEPGRIRSATLLEHSDEWVAFANSLADLQVYFDGPEPLDEVSSMFLGDTKKRYRVLSGKVNSMARRASELVVAPFNEVVRWVEIEKTRRGIEQKIIRTAPINVGTYLREHLFAADNEVTAILTSATMSVGGSFDYISGRLGIDEYESLDVGTPFNFAEQAVLYIPTHLPEPTPANKAAWSSMAINEMLELVRASEGRALLLFTSVVQMREAHREIASRVPFTCMIQGDGSNKELAQRFMDDPSSVLFATKSFMTGVDFQGDACSLVVIDKLPFPVPTEPLFEARAEAIKQAGGNDFSGLTIPMMTLTLKQAFGRLIRHRNDKGVVAILDGRLKSKGYGKGIVKSLPDARPASTMAEVEEFFGQ